MKLNAFSPALFALLAAAALPSAALAQGRTDYALNDNQVQFRVPATWVAIMEKTDGNPQAIAFQVPDQSAQGSDDIADVTVKTRQLKSAAEFNAVLEGELERARTQSGYQVDTSNPDDTVHQYFLVRGPTRYLVRDAFQLNGEVAVEVRCRRPLLAATPATWNSQFDSACAALITSLKR